MKILKRKRVKNIPLRKRRIIYKKSQNKILYSIFERIPIPIFIINRNCSILYKNIEADRVILKSKNKISRNIKHLFSLEDQNNLLKNLEISFHNRSNIKIPLSIETKESDIIKVNCIISPISRHNNLYSKFLIIFEDITYLKQIEEQLIHSQKMEIIGMFTGSIAHDFNNMLTAIIGYSDFLIESYKNKDSLYNYMVEIKKAGERAASLSKQLLRFTRRQKTKPEIININEFILDMGGMVQKLIGEKISLKITKDDTPCYIKIDRSQLEQIIMNLVINAHDAMPEGGFLHIEIKSIYIDKYYAVHYSSLKPGPYVSITVKDSGIGMNKDIIEHIFEPFFTTKEKGKGTGLGLSTVYGIVKQWKGDIFVYSKPNDGTTFKIFFPQVNEIPKYYSNNYNLNNDLRGRETILLVEDDETVRGLINHTFTAYGYKVIETSNPKEAISLITSYNRPIDILITDIIMPDMNGNELADYVLTKYPDIKIIYISGYMHSNYDSFIKDNSSHIFLQKPLKPGELLRKTRQLLNQAEKNTLV